jgi:hypothetical protein
MPEQKLIPLPSRHNWSKAEALNQIELLLHFARSPLAESSVTEALVWVSTGIDDNTYNGVGWTRLDDVQADDVIQATITHFIECKQPFLWYVDESSRPPDLDKRLEQHGCVSMAEGVCMALDLNAMNTSTKPVAGLAIKRVQTPDDMAQWSLVYNQDEQREKLFISLGLTGEPRLRHYLALLDGQPVGTSSAFYGSESVGLYHVEVISEARRQGIGIAITLAPLIEAREAGYQIAVLGPTPEAQSMYARIGFELLPQHGQCYTLPSLY